MSRNEREKLNKIKELKRTQLKKRLKVATAAIAGIAVVAGLFLVSSNKISLSNLFKQEADTPATDVTTVTIAEDGAIECDSILQGVRDSNLADGTYTFRVNGKTSAGATETKNYAVELINYTSDMHYSLSSGQTSTTISLGDTTTAYKMLVVKYHGDLTIDSGVTLTAQQSGGLTYKKGMSIVVMGKLTNNGTISMTARGTYNIAGENVYLWKNTDSNFEYVPALGATGGAETHLPGTTGSSSQSRAGYAGNNGTARATGGGGAGAAYGGYRSGPNVRSGAGGRGTSYSGGSGSGGILTQRQNTGWSYVSGAGSSTGGAGGVAKDYRDANWTCITMGGVGNKNGYDVWGRSSGAHTGTSYYNSSRPYGTGGLLNIYSDSLVNRGTISSNGVGSVGYSYGSWTVGSGSSGAGSVNIFTRDYTNIGSVTATGGVRSGTNTFAGGNGGNGSITVTEISTVLNYVEKTLDLRQGEIYTIDLSKIQINNVNTTSAPAKTLGTISYSSYDSSIATVDASGKITAIAPGKTKIKITDTNNDVSTYIFVEVTREDKIHVQESVNFTTNLKQNGTVWTYGFNDKGQLGDGTNTNATKPVQVLGAGGNGYLTNIKQIASGTAHNIALAKDGKIYTWGYNAQGQLGNGTIVNSTTPEIVTGLTNIRKVDAYKNLSIALRDDGKVYTWGDGYQSLPMQFIINKRIVDISGNLLLGEDGYVYTLENPTTPVAGLKDICKISAGTAHNLALASDGVLYGWGTNTYGEIGTATGTRGATALAIDVMEISAGNQTTMFRTENGKLYVMGNNATGRIGLGAVASANTPREIILTNSTRVIEEFAAGEGMHSGLADTEGFVWNTGTNLRGELGIGSTTNQTVFTQVGDTELATNWEHKYMDVGDTATLVAVLDNTYNLKIDLIDNEQSNFQLSTTATNVSLSGMNVTATGYGIANIVITHGATGKTKTVQIEVTTMMDSIVQGFRDIDLPDGEYPVVINNQSYTVELINYYDDMHYSLDAGQTAKTISLGDTSTTYKTLVVKYHKNLTIDKGVTVTATAVNGLTYKKGMYICVLGNTYNNGTISMTQRGTYNVEGENVYLWKNINNTYEYVPAVGASGGAASYLPGNTGSWSQSNPGKAGANGTNRATGGGGSGGAYGGFRSGTPAHSGAGGAGTSYSGGTGSGGLMTQRQDIKYSIGTANGSSTGGAGSTSVTYRDGNWTCISYGGTGNKNGYDIWGRNSGYYTGTSYYTNRPSGTGGLLTLYSDVLYNNGTISSNGTDNYSPKYGSWSVGGGASGGGSVNIFAREIGSLSNLTATNGRSYGASFNGGNGGSGSITVNILGSVLNFKGNPMTLKTSDTKAIDKSKLYYTKLNDIQTYDLTVGTLIFESLDTSIATVDSNGNVTGIKKGRTRIKVTDISNHNYTTYVTVNVLDTDEFTLPQIEEGTNFTVTLKSNGTVWTYGKNINGQLGNNTTDDSNKPVQVVTVTGKGLENIVDIGAGSNSSIAVNKDGQVYIWGLYKRLENATAVEENKLVATRITGLNNIVKVESYNNQFYAIDASGDVYVFGDTYDGIVQLDTDKIKMKDVDGDLLLSDDGFIYTVGAPTTKNPYLNNIITMSKGTDASAFVTNQGLVQTLGNNASGQLGNGNTVNSTVYPTIVTKSDGSILEDVYDVSMGASYGMCVTFDGEAYTWGNNTAFKIGLESTGKTILNATKITKVQDLEGKEIELKNMEIVAAGNSKGSLMDEEGFVYSVGLNTNGELGTLDNNTRTIYTKISSKDILTKPEDMIIKQGQTEKIIISSGNGFNLKSDINASSKVEVLNTNIVKLSITEIAGVDNTGITDSSKMKENFTIKGNKIGRVCLVVTDDTGFSKNIWVTIVNNDEKAEEAAKVENGENFSIALKSNGEIYSFGQNTSGELGLGDSLDRSEPQKVEVEGAQIKDISVGKSHTLVLTEGRISVLIWKELEWTIRTR